MGKTTDIIFLVVLLISLLIAFPEYLNKILESKAYTALTGLVIVMIAFFIWLKRQDR